MHSIVSSPLAGDLCLAVELAVLASTFWDANVCAAGGLFPGGLVESPVEHFCRGSDFLPTARYPACAGDSRKSKPILLAFEWLAFPWSPPLETSLVYPFCRRSADRVRDRVGGCAFTPASWLLPGWLRPSHWEILSLMFIFFSWGGGLPGGRPCHATVDPFCRRSTSPPPLPALLQPQSQHVERWGANVSSPSVLH